MSIQDVRDGKVTDTETTPVEVVDVGRVRPENKCCQHAATALRSQGTW